MYSNRDMPTGVVGCMKTDEVLKEVLEYSSDCLHSCNCCQNFNGKYTMIMAQSQIYSTNH